MLLVPLKRSKTKINFNFNFKFYQRTLTSAIANENRGFAIATYKFILISISDPAMPTCMTIKLKTEMIRSGFELGQHLLIYYYYWAVFSTSSW